MSELSMMVTITERSKLTTFLSFYRERQVPVQFISLALGTASNETLNYLGLERSDKCVFASFVTDEKWEELRRGLRRELHIVQLTSVQQILGGADLRALSSGWAAPFSHLETA